MRLEIKTHGRWRHLLQFMVQDKFMVLNSALCLARCTAVADEPIELRIVDSMDVVVLATTGLDWHVPRAAEGYTWVP